MIIAPFAAMLVQMAISRTREYAADRRGAEICGNPLWLASALDKIATAAHHIPNPRAEANPATAHMFIINPLSGERMDNLFSTIPHGKPHRRLQELARGMRAAPERPRPASPQPAPVAQPPQERASPWGASTDAPAPDSSGRKGRSVPNITWGRGDRNLPKDPILDQDTRPPSPQDI